jgi:DNA-binding transcriptional regulator YiaG
MRTIQFRCREVIAFRDLAQRKLTLPLDSYGHFVYIDIMTGNEFRKLRLAAEYSQAKLCRELDVAIRTMTRWETGETPIPKIAELALKYVIEKKREREKR